MTAWSQSPSVVDVVLIEDHDTYRSGLEFFLNNSVGMRCRSYPDAASGMRALETRRADIVIMDIHLPDIDGITCTRRIKERWPSVQVVICTVHEDDEKIFDALRSGATGYLLKRSPVEHILEAMRQVLAGGSPMSPAIARRVVNSFVPRRFNEGLDALSEREQEVLDLLVEGLRVKEIAERLFLSTNTVRSHIRRVYEKLHVQSRVEMMNKVRGQKP